MALKFVQDINLNGLELQNVVLQPLTSAPTTLNSVGRMYFHSTDKKPYWYDGSKFITFPSQSDITTLQGHFTDGRANDALKLGGVALDGLFTALSTSTTNAVSITVGGVSKNITVADLKTSLGLKGLAYKDSLAVSDIPAIPWEKITANTRPTTLAGYGITDAAEGEEGIAKSARKIVNSDGSLSILTVNSDGIAVLNSPLRLVNKSNEISGFRTGVYVATPENSAEGSPYNYASVFNIYDTSQSDLQLAWYRSTAAPRLSMRISDSNRWSEWKDIAFIDSTVTAALKLVTNSGADAVTIDSDGNAVIAKKLKINGATLYYENGVLMVDKPFASTGAVSTKGVGSSSGGGGSVDLTNIVSNILPASGSITSGVSSYNIGATDKRWGTVYANVGNFNNLSASGISAQAININGVSVATLTDINDVRAYAQQVANEAANSIYNTLLGGEVDESLDTIKEILDYVKDLDSENIVVKKTSTITGNGTKNSFDFQHNLNTKDVIVFVYEVSNPYQQVFVDVKMTSTSTITVEFAEAPANGTSYKVVVMA